MFRPYRDVRFSKDKTPYKTHQGVWFGETSLYLQVSARRAVLAGGYWHTSSPQVARLRRAVDDDVAGPLLETGVGGVRRKGFDVGGEQLTRVPSRLRQGPPARRPAAAQDADRVARTSARPTGCRTPEARTEIAKAWRAMAPLVAWLDTHVGRD